MSVKIGDAHFPAPFAGGLEYAAPARGVWNIVHTGMLIPQAHQIFVCAAGCLRGVVLTAAEMGAQDRFSTIEVRENNVLRGDMEELILDGVDDILGKLPKKPPAVLVYTSCIHHFMSCDLGRVFAELRRRHPDIAFTDCYMDPIMRKTAVTPDEHMRMQLYSLLNPRPRDAHTADILGNDFLTDEDSELYDVLRRAGVRVLDITRLSSYEEYQEMAAASLYITTCPSAQAGGDALARRLGGRHLSLPACWGDEETEEGLRLLEETLGLRHEDRTKNRASARAALAEALAEIGDTPIELDYTAHPRPLGLARRLLEAGFAVRRVYLDTISAAEKRDFEALRASAPELLLCPTVSPGMRVRPREDADVLAIGQKAAYFAGTAHFVNLVGGGGLYGWHGAVRLAGLCREAYREPKDTRSVIQIKGWSSGGCCI